MCFPIFVWIKPKNLSLVPAHKTIFFIGLRNERQSNILNEWIKPHHFFCLESIAAWRCIAACSAQTGVVLEQIWQVKSRSCVSFWRHLSLPRSQHDQKGPEGESRGEISSRWVLWPICLDMLEGAGGSSKPPHTPLCESVLAGLGCGQTRGNQTHTAPSDEIKDAYFRWFSALPP